MVIIMQILFILLAVILILAAVYLFVLVRPAARPIKEQSLLCHYAHRGLHGGSIPENSLAAFDAACRAGYGIELDVQLALDGTVMVFHDYTLVRMTGADGKLGDFDALHLKTLRLADTDEQIPTLPEVLALVDGRVPLLIELKGESTDTTLVDTLVPILSAYRGPILVESFNPMLLSRLKACLPTLYRGLLYTNVMKAKKPSVLNAALTAMLTNVLARPDFIAYDEAFSHALPVRICRKLFGAVGFVFTVRTKEGLDAADKAGVKTIFEYIEPTV